MTTTQELFVPDYSVWRHGGWYVNNLRYPSGAVGCVSRNYADRKWRIVCDSRPFDTAPTFPNRDAAARAEKDLADQEFAAARKHYSYDLYREAANALPETLCRKLATHACIDKIMHVAAGDSLTAR